MIEDTQHVTPGITLLFMGDSITFGQYVTPTLRWSDLVASRVNRAFECDEGESHSFYNHGISGETTRQGLERYPRDVQNVHSDVMTLQFGLNDCNCWETDRGLPRVSQMAYRANLIEMIDRARHFGTQQIILSTNHCTLRHKKLANSRTLEENRILYNTIVREVASLMSVTLCDIEKGFEDFAPDELADLLLPEPDLLHLSPKGHEYYADLIFPYISDAIRHCISAKKNTGRLVVQ